MKLLISNQYGAIVMALLPFLYGLFSRELIWQDIFLLLSWSSLYLFTYPFFNLFKGGNKVRDQKWAIYYGLASLLLAIPVLFYHWLVIYAIIAMQPFIAISIYFVKKKEERHLLNDFAGIAIFAIAGVMAYGFNHPLDKHSFAILLYPSSFFIGTTLYIKSMMRERKNPRYLKASILFHGVLVVIFACFNNPYLAFAFVPSFIRAYWLPKKKLSVKRIGLIEILISLLFFLSLLCAT